MLCRGDHWSPAQYDPKYGSQSSGEFVHPYGFAGALSVIRTNHARASNARPYGKLS